MFAFEESRGDRSTNGSRSDDDDYKFQSFQDTKRIEFDLTTIDDAPIAR